MKQQLTNSNYWSIGYYIIALLISIFICITFIYGLCALTQSVSDTHEARLSIIKN